MDSSSAVVIPINDRRATELNVTAIQTNVME